MESTRTIRIVVDASRAVDGSASATRALERMERAQNSVASSLDTLGRNLRSMLGGYLGIQGVRAVVDAADAFTQFSNALRVAGVQGAALAMTQERLFATANQHGVSIGALGQLYGRATLASKELGASQADMLRFSQGVAAALRVQGGSTEAASGALLQLSQAMGAGIVRAEEFNSILEGALPIAQAAARGMDGMGGSVAKLRAAVIEGKVTSRDFFEALLKGFKDTEVQAQSANLTIGGAMTGLNNSWVKFVGALDQAASASKTIVAAINTLSRAMENLGGMARAASSDVLTLLFIAANPGLWVGQAFTAKTPAERLTSKIEDLQGKIAGADARLLKDPGRGADVRLRGQWQTELDALTRERDVLAVGGRSSPFQDDPDNIGISVYRPPSITPKKDKAAEALEDRLDKLRRDTSRELSAANAFAEAASQGSEAVARLETHFRALKSAQDVFGKTADENKDAVDALTKKIEEQMRATERAKSLGDFILDTKALEKANVLLEAENRLINATAEERARELAIIKAKQEFESKGLSDSIEKEREAFEARRSAIEQNERLKAQGEELRKAQELWTEPLKRALQDIQSTAADAFETMLEKGDFSFKSLADTFGRIIRRMAAEFLALATVRPVMSVLVNAIGPSGLGIIGGNTASQLFPGGGSSLISSGGFSGGGFGGLGSIFGGSSGGGGWLSGIGNWLGSPIFPATASMGSIPIGSAAGVPGVGFVEPALMSGGSVGSAGLGGLTWGQGLGSLASIGMGAYNLFSGGGSTGSTISGIGQIAGGIVSLIPGGQVVGPLISLASSLFGGLFGDSGPKIPPMPPLVYGAGEFQPNPVTGSYYTAGRSLNGGSNLASAAGSIGDTVQGLFRKAGLTVVPSRLIGGAIHSGTGNNLNNGQWSPFNFTTADVIYQDRPSWRLFDTDATKSVQQASEFLASYVFRQNVLEGGVTGAGPALTKALASPTPPTTLEGLNQLITMADAYDRLGKAANPVKDQIDQLSDSFAELQAWASKVGLSLEPINTELAKQSERLAQDFIDGMLNPLAVQLRALEDERRSALASAEYIQENFSNVFVDLERITEHFNNRRLTLEQQYYGASVQNLEALIRRLTYGDLANASPDTSLAGTRASYTAALAQARSGDATAIGNLSGYAEAYANTARNYFASGPEYAALVAQMRRDLEEIVARSTGGTSGGGSSTELNQASQNLLAANDQLREIVADLAERDRRREEQFVQLMARLNSMATNRTM